MRKRFNRKAVCSSSNYETSRRSHLELLRENHENNHGVFSMISYEVKVTKHAYISCFGKLIPISDDEVVLHDTLNIIYK